MRDRHVHPGRAIGLKCVTTRPKPQHPVVHPAREGLSIKQESRAYFPKLGAYIGMLRKERGMTQRELARALGVSQQAVFAYEIGDRRISILALGRIAKLFSVPLEDLAGMTPIPVSKRRLSPRAARHAERIQALSKTQQRFLIRILDVLEDQRQQSKQGERHAGP